MLPTPSWTACKAIPLLETYIVHTPYLHHTYTVFTSYIHRMVLANLRITGESPNTHHMRYETYDIRMYIHTNTLVYIYWNLRQRNLQIKGPIMP